MEVARPDNPFSDDVANSPWRHDRGTLPPAVATLLADPAFVSVACERLRQAKVHGYQGHLHPGHLLAVLTEELGEAAVCVAEICRGRQVAENKHDLHTELSQVAAFAIQWMQILYLESASTSLEEATPNV
jgi:hypothetical protein